MQAKVKMTKVAMQVKLFLISLFQEKSILIQVYLIGHQGLFGFIGQAMGAYIFMR